MVPEAQAQSKIIRLGFIIVLDPLEDYPQGFPIIKGGEIAITTQFAYSQLNISLAMANLYCPLTVCSAHLLFISLDLVRIDKNQAA